MQCCSIPQKYKNNAVKALDRLRCRSNIVDIAAPFFSALAFPS